MRHRARAPKIHAKRPDPIYLRRKHRSWLPGPITIRILFFTWCAFWWLIAAGITLWLI